LGKAKKKWLFLMINEHYNDNLAASLGIDPAHPDQRRIMRIVQEKVNLERNLVGIRLRTKTKKQIAKFMDVPVKEIAHFETLNTKPSLYFLRNYALANDVIFTTSIILNNDQNDEMIIPSFELSDDYVEGLENILTAISDTDRPSIRRASMLNEQIDGLHNLLINLREKKNITVQDLALKINDSVENILELEKGYGQANIKLYNRIATEYEIIITHDVIVNFGEDDKEMFIFDEEFI
jgi:transcriptional regulator with XRE-family HTH domain